MSPFYDSLCISLLNIYVKCRAENLYALLQYQQKSHVHPVETGWQVPGTGSKWTNNFKTHF